MTDLETTISKPRYETVAYLAARGMSPQEIAEALGLSTQSINALLSQDRMKFEIKVVRHKLFGKEHQKMFKELVPAAAQAVENVLMSRETKPATRLAAAQEIFDRTIGKPKQVIEHEGSLLKELIEKMDNRGKTIDVSSLPATEVVEYAENPNQKVSFSQNDEEKGMNSMDRWVDENL